MDEQEREIMDLLVKAYNIYVSMEPTHPSDQIDWCNNIHNLQDILSRRILRRDYPQDFITIKPKTNEPVHNT